ncbi:MAG: insulinase family protein, partial [Bacteroidales bacterium]|nr:insulinase family protein [Bacteroidales bacterium]
LSDAGIFSVYAASDTKNIERITDLIYKEMHKLQTLKLGTLQLHRTHLQLIGQTCITYESNLNEMLSIGKNHLIYKEVEPIDCIIKRIESITASDLIELARDLFNKESLSTLLFKK